MQNNETSPMSMRPSMTAAAWVAAGNYASIGMSFLVFVVLARLLTPAEFGIVAVASVFLDILLVLARGGLPDAIVQRRTLPPGFSDTAFWVSTIIGVACCFLLSLVSYPIARLFSMPELQSVLVAMSLTFVIGGLGAIHEAFLQRTFKFRSLSIRSIVANLVSGLLSLGLALNGFGVWSLVAQRVLASVAILIITWVAYPWVPRLRFNWLYAKQQLSFGVRVFGTNLIMMGVTKCTDIVAALWLGPAAVGLLRLAWRCIDVANQIAVFPLKSVALATYAERQQNHVEIERAYLHFIELAAAISLPCFFGMAAVADVMVPIVFGQKWAPAADVLKVLCLVSPTLVSNTFMWPALFSENKGTVAIRLSILQLIACTSLGLLGAYFGILYLVVAHVVTDYLVWPIQHWYFQKSCRVSTKNTLLVMTRWMSTSLIMSLIVYSQLRLTTGMFDPPVKLVLAIGTGLVAYAVVAFIVAPKHALAILASARAQLRKRH